MIDKNIVEESISIFTNYFSKKISKSLVDHISTFCINYSEQNNIPFLIDSIFKTKVDEFNEIFNINKNLVNDIKKKNIKNICYLRPEELNPEKYKSIINKKNLEEYRKNNKATTDAFTCSKCKSKKSVISERQTRSGDEPATIFVTCTECGFCFKM